MCKPSGGISRLPWVRGFCWVLVLCSLLWFVPSALAQPRTAPELQPWPPDSMPLLPLVIALSERAETLQSRLVEREKQIVALQAALLLLREQVQTSSEAYNNLSEALRLAEESQGNLEKELAATEALLKNSQTDYVVLSVSYDDYRNETEVQAAELRQERNAAQLQARIWRMVAIGGIVLSVGGAVALVVVLVK